MPKSIQELAQELSSALIVKVRANGDNFTCLEDDSPDWMTEVIREVHNGDMPNDYTYEFISDAAIAIHSNDDIDNARDELEPDIYTHDLTKWLHSNVTRVEYLTEALQEYPIDDGYRLLAVAQGKERIEVFDALVNALEALAEEAEAA